MEEIKGRIKAIIFDMDGTIIKTEELWRQVNRALLAKYGITTFTAEQEAIFCSFAGMAMINVARRMKEEFKLDDSLETIMISKLEIANELFDRHIEFIDGFEVFHAKLRDLKIPTSIATNAMKANLVPIAQKLEFEKFFGGHVYCPADVQDRPKPDPALFLHAAERLGVKPEECIVFEDSVPGFAAAQAAGMKCIAIKNALNADVLDQVHDAIDSYHEAEDVLKKI